MDARRIPVSLRRDPREVAERHSQANPLTLYCELARGEEVTEALSLYAELHTSRTPQSSPVATAGPVAMAPASEGPWELDFSAAQMNQTVLPGEDKEFWLVVYATGANDLLLTLATIRLTLAYDNISQVTPAPPEPALILAFRTIAVAGQSSVVATSSADTLNLTAGNGATITTNPATKTITVSAGGPFTDLEVTGTLTAAHIHGNIAGSVYTHVRNESGGPLAKGTPVYVTGFSVGQSRPLVGRADAASASTMPAIGILDAELANNASGHCVITGIIENIDTSGLSVNAPLYVASGGGLTATAPDVRAQPVAIVERVNVNNGAIIVTTAGSTGSLANQSAASVAITGGSISGLSSLSAGTITASTAATVTANTASTSTTTGALVVTGGVGIGGAINVGSDAIINGVTVGRGAGTTTQNTACGAGALQANTTGTGNTAFGTSALGANTEGLRNTGVGVRALGAFSATNSDMVAVGFDAFANVTSAVASGTSVAVGSQAGRFFGAAGTSNLNTVNSSVFVGHQARPNNNGSTNQIVIGANAVGNGNGTTVIGTSSTTQSRIFGGNTLATGANGQSTQLGQSSVLLTTPSGATRTATALIPANSIVIGVTARVTTAITGATSFDIGDGTTANLFGDDVAAALDTTSANAIAPTLYANATNVVLTANGGNFTGGAVRLTVHFLTLVAPTS